MKKVLTLLSFLVFLLLMGSPPAVANCNLGVFDAGEDANACGLTATLQAGLPFFGDGVWTGPGTFSNPTSGTTAVTVSNYGAHLFSWTVTNPDCPPQTDFVTVIFDPPPSEAEAGNNINVCGLSTALNGIHPAIGSGVWSGAGLQFSNIYDPNSLVTAPGYGSYTAVWTTSNCECPVSEDFATITFSPPLQANAGTDAEVCGLSHNLQASSSGSSGYWSGPGVFANANSPSTSVQVAGPGTYIFYWNASNDCGTVSDAVTVTFKSATYTAYAGEDVTIYGLSYVLGANLPSGATGQWSGPGTFANPNQPNSVVTVPGPGSYTFTWTVTNGCATASDQVTVNFDPCTVQVDAGVNAETCGLSFYLNASINSSGTGTWSGSANFANPNAANTLVTVNNYGTFNFIWTVNDPVCGAVSDNVVITFGEAPTIAEAGPNANTCSLSYMLNADDPLVGQGQWSGPGTFSDPHDPNATVTVATPGNYSFYWEVSNCTCPSVSDYVNVSFGTELPTSYAGESAQTCGLSYSLAANNPPSGMTASWSGAGTFTNPNSANTVVSVPGPGTYPFTWTVDGGVCGTAQSTVYIEFNSAPQGVFAGANQNVCGNSASLAANPMPAGMTAYWSGPGTFSDIYDPNATITVAGPGTYDFTWTVSNCCCAPVSDVVSITFSSEGTPPNAGADASVCGYSYQLSANTPSVGSGYWSGNGTFANANSPNTLVNVSTPGNYTFNWVVTTNCGTQSDDVHVLFLGNAPAANAGNDDSVCGLTYGLNAQQPVAGTGYWSGNGTFVNPNDPNSAVTVAGTGTYTFTWTTIGNTSCPSNTDQVNITFTQVDPDANAGPDAVYCNQLSHVLSANVPTQGQGSWSGPGTFSDIYDPNATVTMPSYGTYTFTWTVNNGTCGTASDNVQVEFAQQPTTVDAGPDANACALVYALSAASPTNGQGIWSGPGVFSDPNHPNSTVQVPTTGTYTFTWTISNSGCSPIQDQVTITFIGAPSPAIAGPDASYCSLSANLAATAASGGYWSVPAGTSVSNINDENAVFTASSPGTYVLTWITSNACYDNSDQVQITLNTAPQASNAGSDGSACGYTYQLAAFGSGQWSGNGVFSNQLDPNSTVTVSAPGDYTFSWITSNNCGSASDDVTISFLLPPTPVDAGSDQSSCSLTYNLGASGGDFGSGFWTGNGTFGNANFSSTSVTVSAPGTYTYTYTSSNVCGTASDQINVTFGQAPPAAQAGEDFAICGLTASLSAVLPSGVTGSWTGSSPVANPESANTSVTVPSAGLYTYTWTISNECGSTSDQVNVTFLGNAPTVNAGSDATVCTLTYNLAATGGTGAWSGNGSFSNVNTANTTVTVSSPGTYTFTYTSDSQCGTSSDQVNITFGQPPAPANAGADFAVCGLAANLAGVLQSNTTGNWTGTTTISNPASGSTTVTAPAPGLYTYTWTISNECGSTADQVNVTFLGDAPIVNAGADASVCTLSYNLSATGGTGSWSGNGSFANIGSANTTVTVASAGTYTFTYTSDSQCGATNDQVNITFGQAPSVAQAGADFAICGFTANLNAILPSIGTGSWTSGQGISNPVLANSSVTVPSAGTYTYTWTNTNSCGSTSDDVNVTFLGNAPSVDAGTDATVCSLSYNLSATGSAGQWSGNGTFSNVNQPNSTVTVSAPGTYTFTWTGNSQCGSTSDQVNVTFGQSPGQAQAGQDFAACGLATNLNAILPANANGSWTNGPGISSPTSANTLVTVAAPGTYTYTWTVSNSCGSSADNVNVTFLGTVSANAGSDQNVCGLSANLAALQPASGATGSWTGSNANFSNPGSATSSVTVPGYGVYTLYWTVTSQCGSYTDEVLVNFSSPVIANAGNDMEVCGLSYTLSGSGANGTWSGPGVFANPNNATTTVTAPAYGTYTYTWSVPGGACGDSSDSVEVIFGEQPTFVDAGPDNSVCGLSYDMNAVVPAIGEGTWVGPGLFSDSHLANATVTVPTPGTYTFTWIVENCVCPEISDQVSITFGGAAPTANAGPDQSSCSLSANLAASGNGTWSGNGTFSNINDPNATVTVASTGNYTFTWTSSNECGTATDQVNVNFNSGAGGANAGPDQQICGLSAQLGALLPAGATGTWAGSASFANSNDPNTTISVNQYGVYQFTWIVDGPCGSGVDYVVVEFGQQPTNVDAGPDASTCGLSYNLAAAQPSIGIGTWQGPGLFGDSNQPNTTVTVAAPGTYTFSWTVSNCNCPLLTDEVTITFGEGGGIANAGPDQTICGTSFDLAASLAPGATGQWTGPGVFADSSLPNTSVSVASGGSYTFTWTVTDGCGTSSDQVTIVFGENPDLAYAGPDQSVCGNLALLSGTPLSGGLWTGNGTFSTPNQGNTSVTVAGPGTYTFTYTVSNSCGTSSDNVTVVFSEGSTANAGADQTVCGNVAALSGTALSGGQWSGNGTFANANEGNTSVTVAAAGTYTFTYTVTSSCGVSSDNVTIVFTEGETANAGQDQTLCGTSAVLSATPAAGGQWSGNGTFADAGNANTTVSVSAPGTYTFTYTINGSCGASSDDVTIVFTEGETANAGADQTVCETFANLSATPVDGGIWSGNGNFADSNAAMTSVSVAAPGTYTFTYTVTSSCGTSSDEVTIVFAEALQADAGADQTVCGNVAVLEGAPVSNVLWSGNGTFANATEGNTTVTVAAVGTYTYTLSVTDDCGNSSIDQVTIEFSDGAQANAGPDQSVCGLSATMAAQGTGTWTGNGTFASSDGNSEVSVAGPGTYTFTWTTTDDCGVSSDQVDVTFEESPSTAEAGPNEQVCGLSYTLQGNNPAFGQGTWSGSGSFADANNATTTVTVADYGDYTFSWDISNDCGNSMDLVIISFVEGEAVDAGAGGETCGLSFDLAASGTGTWSGNGTFANASSAATTVTVVAPGTYTFTWTGSGECSANASDDVTVIFSENEAVANAGADDSICGLSYTLAGTPETGTWTGSGTFADANDPNTVVTVADYGNQEFVWTATSDCGTASDAVTISFVDPMPTQATVGENETVCGLTYTLTGNTPVVGTGTWSGAGTFSDENDPNATVTVAEAGDYTFSWSIANECDSSADLMIITFTESTATANAGIDAVVCGLSHQLSATAAAGGQWSGAGITFADPTDPTTTMTATTAGIYTATWTVDSDCGQASDSVEVELIETSTADAGNDDTTCGTSYALMANVAAGQTGTWTGNGTFADATDPNTTVAVSAAGEYTFTWTLDAGDPCPATSDQVTINFTEGVGANAGMDDTTCGIFLYQLSAQLPEGESGLWSGAGTFANATDPMTSVAVLEAGTYVFTWTVTGSSCGSGSDEVEITFIEPLNANAGANGANCDLDYTMNAGEVPEGATGYWSPVDGLTITDVSDPNTTVMAAEAGMYSMTWNLERDGCESDTDVVVLDLGAGNEVTADAGPDDQQCGLIFELSAQLSANATGFWTGLGTFADANSPNTEVTVDAYGVYIFTWNVESTCGSSSDQVQVEFGTQPTIVDAGPDDSVCGLSYTFDAAIPDVGLGFWLGEGEFSASANPGATVTVSDYGTYTFVWSVENCNCPTVSDEVVITFEDCTQVEESVTAVDDEYSTEMNEEITISPMNNDIYEGNNTVNYSAVTQPAHGTVMPLDNNLVYMPNEGYVGPDVFTYTVCDSAGNCDTAIVTINIVYTPTECEYVGDFCTEPLTSVSICIVPCDINNGFITDLTTTYNCSLSVTSDICFQYTPLPGFLGQDQIVITYCDTDGNCESHYADITVVESCEGGTPNDSNETPVTEDDQGSTVEGGSVTISPLLNDNDPNDDELTIASVGSPSNGTATINGYDIVYTPAPGFTGVDSFGYTVCDSNGACATAIITITVVSNDGNNAPFANDDNETVEINEIAAVDVLANDSDPDGDSFYISDYGQPTNGTVVQGGTNLLYTPDTDYVGADSFTYEICDTEDACVTATVSINVVDSSACNNPALCTTPVTPTEVCIDFCTIDDADVTVQDVHTLFDCSINLLGGTCVQYTGLPAFYGEEQLEVTGCDSEGNCETITVIITVQDDCSQEPTEGKAPGETLLIPNFFSPNSDGLNDYWLVKDLPDEDDLYVRVFDLRGQMMYEQRISETLLWDGRASGALLPGGIYAYSLGNGKNVHYTGLLNIRR